MTYKTESQSKMLDHFRKTNDIRKWANKELNIKPTLREYVIWNIQKVGVHILSIFPPTLFMKVFELFRKLFK